MSYFSNYIPTRPASGVLPEKQIFCDPIAREELAADLYAALSLDLETTKAVASRLKANKPKWGDITNNEIYCILQYMRTKQHAIATIAYSGAENDHMWRFQKGPVPL